MKTILNHITATAGAAVLAAAGLTPLTADAGHPIGYTSPSASAHAWAAARSHGDTLRELTDRLETTHRYDLRRSHRWEPYGIDALLYNSVVNLERSSRAFRDATRCTNGAEVIHLAEAVACSFATVNETARRVPISRDFDRLLCAIEETVGCIRGADYLHVLAVPVYRPAPVAPVYRPAPVVSHTVRHSGHTVRVTHAPVVHPPVIRPPVVTAPVVRHPVIRTTNPGVIIHTSPTVRAPSCRIPVYR